MNSTKLKFSIYSNYIATIEYSSYFIDTDFKQNPCNQCQSVSEKLKDTDFTDFTDYTDL